MRPEEDRMLRNKSMSMSKLERFLTAVQLKTPDIVPVSPQIHDRFAHKMLGRTGWEAVFQIHQRIGSIYYCGPLTVGVKSSPPEGWKYEDRIIQTDGTRVVTENIMITPEGTLRGKIVKGFNLNDLNARRAPSKKRRGLDDL